MQTIVWFHLKLSALEPILGQTFTLQCPKLTEFYNFSVVSWVCVDAGSNTITYTVIANL